jgi:aryl-alcohol dehydrogenase-like predicted oxidoreductase
MKLRKLGKAPIAIAPVVLGGNVFGWTISEHDSFAVLDAFMNAGFNAIDTADVYSSWHPGNRGGESETIIGKWLKSRPGQRDKTIVMTKVGSDMGGEEQRGLSKRWISDAVDHSLRRLQTDYIDVYFSHWPDPSTPQEETLEAFGKLRDEGKIRALGASNLNANQLRSAQEVAHQRSVSFYEVLQPEYNLIERGNFEGEVASFCEVESLGVVTYFSLASGFLTGKYRSANDLNQSQRGEDVAKYLNSSMRVLAALDNVARRHSASQTEVALGWLLAKPAVTAPIASATRPSHVQAFARAVELELTREDMAELDSAS